MDYESRGTFAPFAGLTDADFARTLSAALYARWPVANNYDCPDAPAVGTRVRLRRDLPGSWFPRGLAGTVTMSEADELVGLIAVTLDEPVCPDASGDTVLYWETDHASDAPDAYAAFAFWQDCAAIVNPSECR
jgi:hypothetical protein